METTPGAALASGAMKSRTVIGLFPRQRHDEESAYRPDPPPLWARVVEIRS